MKNKNLEWRHMTTGITSRIYNGSRYGRGNFSPDVPVDLSRYPTVMQASPASTVSAKYGFIPTTRPVQVLSDYGWFPVAVHEAGTRDENKAGFQTHVIRFAHENYNREMAVGGTIPQLILKNDHCGMGSFSFFVGLYEKVCANQLCVSRGSLEDVRVCHRGYADSAVEDCIRNIMGDLPSVLSNVDRFKGIELRRHQEIALAESAIELRWDGDAFAVRPEELLARRHYEQRTPTLWNTYNAIQENMIRGGVRQVNADGRRSRARAVKSVKEDLRLNKALWTLTERLAEVVAA
ncbi:MAG: DUF932 domain-containing protein [Hyphomicrobiaceae bacterium]|nr:MAG: DUF932 domain-containing protein [Hyphomicrobiaceae bacterium]